MVCNENNLEISLLVMFYMTKDESCETSGVGYCGFWGDGGCDFMVQYEIYKRFSTLVIFECLGYFVM